MIFIIFVIAGRVFCILAWLLGFRIKILLTLILVWRVVVELLLQVSCYNHRTVWVLIDRYFVLYYLLGNKTRNIKPLAEGIKIESAATVFKSLGRPEMDNQVR